MAESSGSFPWARAAWGVVAAILLALFARYSFQELEGPPDHAKATRASSTPTTTKVPATTTPLPSGGPCGPANSLAALGDVERATRAYQTVLQADPNSTCAAAGLTALNSVVKPAPAAKPDPCTVGEALREAGATTEAKAVLVEALKAADDACSRQELERVTAQRWPDRAQGIVTDIGKLLALGGLVAIVLFVVWTPFSARRWRTLARFRKPSLVFDPLKDPSIDPKPAAAVTALTAAAYHQVDDSVPWPTVGQVDSHLELSGVLDLDKVLSQLGGAAALLKAAERLAGAERLTVSGQLHPAGSKGPGLTIRLAGRSGVVDVDTARLPALPAGKAASEESFADLAVFAAAWTRHQAGKHLGEAPPTLTTRESVSYAWLVTGQAAAARADHATALAYYQLAVDADQNHLRALIQRAIALTDTDADYDLVAAAISRVLEVLEDIDV